MVYEATVIRDIDKQLAEQRQRSEVRYREIQYQFRVTNGQVGALRKMLEAQARQIEASESRETPPTLTSGLLALAGSWWFKLATLLLLLGLNVGFEQSTKILGLLR